MNAQLAEQTSQYSELDAISQENIEHIKNGYIAASLEVGQFSTAEEAEAALNQHEIAARANNHLTINMSTGSLEHLLQRGRFETYWDSKQADSADEASSLHTNNKAMHGEYERVRTTADSGYRTYAPHDAERTDPIYAAVATGVDKRGAAPAYGNCWVVLSEELADRAVYGFSDSHASVVRSEDGDLQHDSSTILNRHDALAAKAVTELVDAQIKSLKLRMLAGNLVIMEPGEERPNIISVHGRTPGYVEAAIFDPIELDDIAEIHVAMTDRKTMHDVGVLLRTNPTFANKAHLEDGATTSNMVDDWLAARRATQAEDPDSDQISPLWEQLGLSPENDMADISAVLKRTASILLRDISRITYKPGDIRLVNFTSDMQWHNYLQNIRTTGRYLPEEKQPQLQQLLADLTDVQEARVFFNDDEVVLG
jgi:hypothetical protein